MDFFDYAVSLTLKLEGENSNHPLDRGGKTRYGITQGMFDYSLNKGSICGITNIDQLTIVQAKAIYKTEFWFPLKLDRVLNRDIAAEIFDTAVNSGIFKAAMIAQFALDYLGESLDIDGVLGPGTLSLINKWCEKDPRSLFISLNGFQFIHYVLLVDGDAPIEKLKKYTGHDSSQVVFARGWTKRIQSYKEDREV